MQSHQNLSDFIARLSGSHHFILDYLTNEVLQRLPRPIQSFLLQTAVLDRLSASLCDAVTGRDDSAAVLQHLYASNAFVISLDDERLWYRYHHLFADLLRHQLARTQPERAPLLHQRASEWYEQQGDVAEAIEHAFAAQDYERAVRLLDVHARSTVLQGYAQTVETWLQRLPLDWQTTGPRARLAFAWSLLLRGQLELIEPHLRAVEATVETGVVAGETDAQAMLAETLALRALARPGAALAARLRGRG